MITLNFSMWELAVLLIGISFVVGAVYLVKLLKNLAATVESTNRLMEENRIALHNIIANADSITKSSAEVLEKTNDMVDEVEGAFNVIKSDVIDPVVKSAAMLKKVLGVLQSSKFSKKSKE
ncbi:DUF948 domain-containing protein [Eubacteriaceae bacterium ES3]|nr:DUF948 domain-containing protein [Eubacteriaceae bacterium ES3]